MCKAKHLDGTTARWAETIGKGIKVWNCCRSVDSGLPVVRDEAILGKCLVDETPGSDNRGNISHNPTTWVTSENRLISNSNEPGWDAGKVLSDTGPVNIWPAFQESVTLMNLGVATLDQARLMIKLPTARPGAETVGSGFPWGIWDLAYVASGMCHLWRDPFSIIREPVSREPFILLNKGLVKAGLVKRFNFRMIDNGVNRDNVTIVGLQLLKLAAYGRIKRFNDLRHLLR